MPRMTPR